MKTIKILLTLLAVPLVFTTALSQEAGSGNAMKCLTSDGTITIQGNSVQMRDYDMRAESIEREGVIRLVDSEKNATAVLDSRDPDGLYLAIIEDGTQMQVVAPKTGMVFTYAQTNTATAPATPEIDVVRELHTQYNAHSPALTAITR